MSTLVAVTVAFAITPPDASVEAIAVMLRSLRIMMVGAKTAFGSHPCQQFFKLVISESSPSQQRCEWDPFELLRSVTSPKEGPGVKGEIQGTNDDACSRKEDGRYIRIDQRIQIMQQEATLVGRDASPVLQPVFQQRQRAWPRKDFYQDSPNQAGDVYPPEQRTRASDQGPKSHPQDKEYVQA